jgi:hypothetical protein
VRIHLLPAGASTGRTARPSTDSAVAVTLTNRQVAATLALWMGVDWTARRPQAGHPIVSPATP